MLKEVRDEEEEERASLSTQCRRAKGSARPKPWV